MGSHVNLFAGILSATGEQGRSPALGLHSPRCHLTRQLPAPVLLSRAREQDYQASTADARQRRLVLSSKRMLRANGPLFLSREGAGDAKQILFGQSGQAGPADWGQRLVVLIYASSAGELARGCSANRALDRPSDGLGCCAAGGPRRCCTKGCTVTLECCVRCRRCKLQPSGHP